MRERVARWSYAALWIVATPLVAGYLAWRARRQPAYRRGWPQRFLGRYGVRRSAPSLWIHAVSVGETRAAAPLIDALLERHPDRDVLMTHMTPTGYDTAVSLFGDRVLHAYLAYDYPHAVHAFLRHWRPQVGIVMETEIWPNLMAAARARGVPMVLANARLSPKSLDAALRWPALMRPAARGFARVLAQTDADAGRFAELIDPQHEGAGSIVVVGNVKFDTEPPASQRALAARFRSWLDPASHGSTRVFLCASTREGEEASIFDAWLRHRDRPDGGGPLLLVVVPRHPQRFDEVFELARTRGLAPQRRSEERPLASGTRVWIGDSMGELWAHYLAADIAYVGGSVVPLGGQNLIEAAASGCPVLVGRHTFNFAAASDEAVEAGAALRVDSYDALVMEAAALVRDDVRRERMARAGIEFAAAHRGATGRTVSIVEEVLAAWGGDARISRP